MRTDQLIANLARDVQYVQTLGTPWRRMLAWTGMGVVYLTILVAVMSLRADLGARLQEPRFLIEQTSALLTVMTASAAAFASVVPGYRRDLVLWPLPFLMVWLAAVLIGALPEFRVASNGILFKADWRCVVTVLAGATVPAIAMAIMLRRGAPLTPRLTTALGGLAAAGLGNLGVCMFHPHDSNAIVLVWHCGTVLILAALAAATGSLILRWPSAPRVSRFA